MDRLVDGSFLDDGVWHVASDLVNKLVVGVKRLQFLEILLTHLVQELDKLIEGSTFGRVG